MASQEAEKFFDTQSEEGSPAAAASTPTLEEAPMQPTQARFPRPAPNPPSRQSLEDFRLTEEIRMATISSLAEVELVNQRPAKAPPSSPKAKAPPPELVQLNVDYEFRNLADDAAPALAPWPINSPPPPATCNAEPGPDPILPLESSSSAQSQSEQRTTASQGTTSTVQERQLLRPPINDRQAQDNAWANFTEVGDVFYHDHRNRQRTRDIRVPREVWLRWRESFLPRQQLWASPLFEDPGIATERDFIKAWHTAAHTHDHGIRRMWKLYCEARGDGTQDPHRVAPGFSRIFLHVYCSQEPDFFAQHINARLLPLGKEEELMREGAAAFEAIHVRYEPPLANWPPAEVFLTLPAAPVAQRNAHGAHWQGPAQPYASQHQQPAVYEEAPWWYGAPTSGWYGEQQWWQTQPGNWDWTSQQGGWVSRWQWQSWE